MGSAHTGAASRDFCRPSVAMNAAGQTVVSWANNGRIRARRYDYSGQALEANPIPVDNTPADDLDWQSDGRAVSYIPVKPVVAIDNTGNFIVAWPQLKTRVKAILPKDSEYDSSPVEFRHELSASIMAQRFENGQPTNLRKGTAVDAELVKESEKVDQDISLALSDSSHLSLAWANRFEDFRQLVDISRSNYNNIQHSIYAPAIKGNVFIKNISVKNGLLTGAAALPVATASTKLSGSDAFSAHWLPALATDSKGNLDVMWIKQNHLDSYYFIYGYTRNGVSQLDKFDSLTAFLPGKLK